MKRKLNNCLCNYPCYVGDHPGQKIEYEDDEEGLLDTRINMAAPKYMDRFEFRVVTCTPGKMWNNDDGTQAKMQKCLDEGFLLLRADTTNDSIVYIFSRTTKAQ